MTLTAQHDPTLGVEYVDVDDEPNHVEQFKNEYVRVYLATIAPGARTLYHRHCVNTLYIVMAGGLSRSDEPGHQKQRTGVGRSTHATTKLLWWSRRKLGRTLRLPTGTLLAQYHGEFPLTHRLCAAAGNEQPMRMLGIELLTNPDRQLERAPSLPGLPVEYEDAQVIAYRIELAPGERTSCLHLADPGVLAVVSGSAQQLERELTGASNNTLAAGAVQWLDQDDALELANPAATPLHAVLITLARRRPERPLTFASASGDDLPDRQAARPPTRSGSAPISASS